MSDLNLNLLYPSEYVKAEDLKGKTVMVKVADIRRENLPMAGGKKEYKVVLYMEGKEKKLVMNKTNGTILALLFGTDLANARGKRIQLTPDVDKMGGDLVACIRITDSPDADQDARDALAKAWNERGGRQRGALVNHIKKKISARTARTMKVAGPAAPTTPAPVDDEDMPPLPPRLDEDFSDGPVEPVDGVVPST